MANRNATPVTDTVNWDAIVEDFMFRKGLLELEKAKHCCAPVIGELRPGVHYVRPADSTDAPTVLKPEWLIGGARLLWNHLQEQGYNPRIDYWVRVINRPLNNISAGKWEEGFDLGCHRPHDSKIICGNNYAHEMLQKVAVKSRRLLEKGIFPKMLIVHAGDKPDDRSYRVQIQNAAVNIGVIIEEIELDEHPTAKELRERLFIYNNNPDIAGVLVQTIRDAAVDKAVREGLSKWKDPEMIDKSRMGDLYTAAPGIEVNAPCTAMSARAMIHLGFGGREKVAGNLIAILNNGPVIGSPVEAMLNRIDGASTFVTNHHFPRERLVAITRQADAIITATGKRGILRPGDVKPGCVIVDCGIIREGDRVVGDLNFEEMREVAGAITPVPGGVGPGTTACLLRNLINQVSERHGWTD